MYVIIIFIVLSLHTYYIQYYYALIMLHHNIVPMYMSVTPPVDDFNIIYTPTHHNQFLFSSCVQPFNHLIHTGSMKYDVCSIPPSPSQRPFVFCNCRLYTSLSLFFFFFCCFVNSYPTVVQTKRV